LLIPRSLAPLWHGCIDPQSGAHMPLNTAEPLTDYDRACASAWPGRGVLTLGHGSALVLYTEFDLHAWDDANHTLACGGWLPAAAQLDGAPWSDPFLWTVVDSDVVLINSAQTGFVAMQTDAYIPVHLVPGTYRVEYVDLEADSVGCFHRFTATAAKMSGRLRL